MPRCAAPEFRDQWLDQTPVSELLGISEPALEQDRCNPKLGIPFYRFGTRIRYRLSEVIAWAEARRVEPQRRQRELV